MKEITGELWDYFKKDGIVICITTNGTVKKNGEGVLGRGCALEATKRIPGIAKLQAILRITPGFLGPYVINFPVKHNWWEQADLDLITKSALWLKREAELAPHVTFILPRPGCGNGRLQWRDVKPLLESLPDNVWVISK